MAAAKARMASMLPKLVFREQGVSKVERSRAETLKETDVSAVSVVVVFCIKLYKCDFEVNLCIAPHPVEVTNELIRSLIRVASV